jgi:hypothetical protein
MTHFYPEDGCSLLLRNVINVYQTTCHHILGYRASHINEYTRYDPWTLIIGPGATDPPCCDVIVGDGCYHQVLVHIVHHKHKNPFKLSIQILLEVTYCDHGVVTWGAAWRSVQLTCNKQRTILVRTVHTGVLVTSEHMGDNSIANPKPEKGTGLVIDAIYCGV